MGCGMGRSAYIVIDGRARLETPNDFRKQINILIKKNPLYSLKNFDDKEKTHELNKVFCLLSKMNTNVEIEEFFENIKNIFNFKLLFSEGFKNIFSYGINQFSYLIHDGQCAEKLFLLIVLFLSNPNKTSVKIEKLKFIRSLILSTREDLAHTSKKDKSQNQFLNNEIYLQSFNNRSSNLEDKIIHINNSNIVENQNKSIKGNNLMENEKIKENIINSRNNERNMQENKISNLMNILFHNNYSSYNNKDQNSNSNLNSNYENNLILLRENTVVTNNNYKYKSGHFSFIISTLLNFFSYMFIYFFVIFSFLPLDENQLIKLLIRKEKVGEFEFEKLNEYMMRKFHTINRRLDPKNLMACCLSYVFEPIKSLVKSQSNENLVEINDAEIDEILSRIVYIFNPYSMVEVFITLKVKDY